MMRRLPPTAIRPKCRSRSARPLRSARRSLFGQASAYAGGSVLVICDTFGTCEVELEAYLRTLKDNPNAVDQMIAQANGVLDSFLVSGAADAFDIGNGGVLRVQQAFLQLVICVDNDPVGAATDLAAAYTKNPAGFAALANTTDVYNGATVLNAVESYTRTGNTGEFAMAMELAKYPPAMDLSGIASLAAFGYELTPVADAIGVVTAAANGEVAGIMIVGIGFLPIAKVATVLDEGADVVRAVLKEGGAEAAKIADEVAKKAPIHHICTNKNCISSATGGPWTPRFEQIFRNAGLNLEDAINKIAVPGHKGPHPQSYHAYVFRELDDATAGLAPGTSQYTNAVARTLEVIKQQAVTPGHPVNTWLTKAK